MKNETDSSLHSAKDCATETQTNTESMTSDLPHAGFPCDVRKPEVQIAAAKFVNERTETADSERSCEGRNGIRAGFRWSGGRLFLDCFSRVQHPHIRRIPRNLVQLQLLTLPVQPSPEIHPSLKRRLELLLASPMTGEFCPPSVFAALQSPRGVRHLFSNQAQLQRELQRQRELLRRGRNPTRPTIARSPEDVVLLRQTLLRKAFPSGPPG